MARDWIKREKGLSNKREVVAVSIKLGVDRRLVAECCGLLWDWADSETTDGHIEGVDAAYIDALVGLPGFALALSTREVGWLRITESGITLPNWGRHNGESAKKRAIESEKKKRQRGRPVVVPDSVPQTSGQGRDESISSLSLLSSGSAIPEGGGEGETAPIDPIPPGWIRTLKLPADWSTDEQEAVRREIGLWTEYQADLGKRCGPTVITGLLADCLRRGWSGSKIAQCMVASRGHGWKTLRDPDEGLNGQAKEPPASPEQQSAQAVAIFREVRAKGAKR